MHFITNVFATAIEWAWSTAGWWIVGGFAVTAAVVAVVEWRRR